MPISMTVRDLMVPIDRYAVATVDQTLGEAIPNLRKLYCEVEWGKCTEAGHRTILVLDQTGNLVGILDFKTILSGPDSRNCRRTNGKT